MISNIPGVTLHLFLCLMDVIYCFDSDSSSVPKINTDRDTYHFQLGRIKVLLECNVKGATPLDISWLKNGRIINNSYIDNYETVRKMTEEDTHTFQLWITKMTGDDVGLYTCRALNNYGQDEKNVTIELIEEQPENKNFDASSNSTGLTLLAWISIILFLKTYTIRGFLIWIL